MALAPEASAAILHMQAFLSRRSDASPVAKGTTRQKSVKRQEGVRTLTSRRVGPSIASAGMLRGHQRLVEKERARKVKVKAKVKVRGEVKVKVRVGAGRASTPTTPRSRG